MEIMAESKFFLAFFLLCCYDIKNMSKAVKERSRVEMSFREHSVGGRMQSVYLKYILELLF